MLDSVQFESQQGKIFFSFLKWSYLSWGPPKLLFNGYWSSFMGVKQPHFEVDHSPPPSIKVKSEWSYSFAPCICHHGIDRDNITFTFHEFLMRHWELPFLGEQAVRVTFHCRAVLHIHFMPEYVLKILGHLGFDAMSVGK